MTDIQKIQNRLLKLAKNETDIRTVRLAVKAIQAITINKMYDNLHKDMAEQEYIIKAYNVQSYGKEVGEIIVKTFRRDN